LQTSLSGNINLDQPERIRVYDAEDRYLAGHPGTPSHQPPAGRLACAIRRAIRQRAARRRPADARSGLVVINGGGVPEHICGPVTLVDFSELAEACYDADTLERVADEVRDRFGNAAGATVRDLRQLAAGKRAQNASER